MNFRTHKGLLATLQHGEGGEVIKNDPVLLARIDELFNIEMMHKSMRTVNNYCSVDLIVFMRTWWP